MGFFFDCVNNVFLLVFMLLFVLVLVSFFFWGFVEFLLILLVFVIVYGWFVGGFVIFWLKFGIILFDDFGLVYSMMVFGKGIGNIFIGFISMLLMVGLI